MPRVTDMGPESVMVSQISSMATGKHHQAGPPACVCRNLIRFRLPIHSGLPSLNTEVTCIVRRQKTQRPQPIPVAVCVMVVSGGLCTHTY